MHRKTQIIAAAAWVLIAAGSAGCKSRQTSGAPTLAATEPAAQEPPAAPLVPSRPPPPPARVVPPAPPPPAVGLREILLEGRKAYNAGELDRAVVQFKKAADMAPTAAEPLVDLGRTLVRQGSQYKALVALSRAVELKPDDAFALLNVGHLLTLMGDGELGLDYLRKAANLKPRHGAILCGLVLALKKAGLAEELATALKKAEEAGSPCPEGKDPFATYGDVKPPH